MIFAVQRQYMNQQSHQKVIMEDNKQITNRQIRDFCTRSKPTLDKLVKLAKKAIHEKLEGVVMIPDDHGLNKTGKKQISEYASLMLLTNESLNTDERQRLNGIIKSTIERDEIRLRFFTWDLEHLWGKFCDQPDELSLSISQGYPVLNSRLIDSLMLSAKLRNLVLEQFSNYVLAICFSGSFARLTYTQTSDFDLFVVVDDTSVKKMTKDELELKITDVFQGFIDKLNVQHPMACKINLQTYLLTEFWQFIKNHSSVVHTLLRDGIPLYDKGIFVVWKNMLNSGLLQPSATACELFVNDSEERFLILGKKINGLVIEDMYWILIQYAQATLMISGIPALTDRETIELLLCENVNHKLSIKQHNLSYLKELVETRKTIERQERECLSVSEFSDHFHRFSIARVDLRQAYERQKFKNINKKLNLLLQTLNVRLQSIVNELISLSGCSANIHGESLNSYLYAYQIGGQSLMDHVKQIKTVTSEIPESDFPVAYFEHAFHSLERKLNDIENIFGHNAKGEKARIEKQEDMYLLIIPIEKKIVDLSNMTETKME